MTIPDTIQVGDMAAPGYLPAELRPAIHAIASGLHQSFDQMAWIRPGKSKESCILCSMAVRDFLYRVGFRDATVRPVTFYIDYCNEAGKGVRSLELGTLKYDAEKREGYWDGHAVVTTRGWLIDTTLYQATPRPEWSIPPMMAAPMLEEPGNWFGFPLLAGGGGQGEGEAMTRWGWLDRPDNISWTSSGDARQKWRRERVTDYLVKLYQRAKQVHATAE